LKLPLEADRFIADLRAEMCEALKPDLDSWTGFRH
jgi:hypothetical protein